MGEKKKQTNWRQFYEHDNPETGGSSTANDEVELAQWKAASLPQSSRQQWDGDFIMESEECSADAGAVSEADSVPCFLFRRDSTNFKTLLYNNLESSNGFSGFHRRMGSDMRHKYCSCCKISDMVFIFVQVVMGMFLTCVAIERLQSCQEEYFVFAYLISDGILSVFLFPIIVMNWSQRVGGCLHEDDNPGSGVYWITSFALRVLTLCAGTVLLVFNVRVAVGENMNVCQITYTIFFISVCAEWTYLVLGLIVPTFFCVTIYWCARLYN